MFCIRLKQIFKSDSVAKCLGLMILWFSACGSISAGEMIFGQSGISAYDEDTIDQSEVFMSVEQKPEFPGGEAALMKFINENINYPLEAARDSVEGRVVVQFIVDKEGNVGRVKVARPVNEYLDQEAVRVCQLLPKFTPGYQNGEPVNVFYSLPVKFKLFEDEKQPVQKQQDEKQPAQKQWSGFQNKRTIFEQSLMPEDKVEFPEFPGGENNLMKFLRDHLKYPAAAKRRGSQGRVVVKFVVDEKGNISEVSILESMDIDLDLEAIRVCRSLPRFRPAKVNGKPVKVWYILPVTFKLDDHN